MTELRFGLTIPLSATADAAPVALALAAEQLGFDFVSAADHPATGEPTHETWTMLSWIAAHTSRIAIATKVLGVPFRAPAMTAKMAETLQRLSGGRLILGLGGGYSNDEIGSLGLPTRTPGEKVQALEDALRIIQGLWTASEFTYSGRHYQVTAAQVQPKPEHPIPIWLGTFGDRALALTGRLADGWIPSLGFAPPEVIPAMRERILAAAHDAGRDPDDITCAYHMEIQLGPRPAPSPTVVSGPSEHVAERLASFVSLGFTALNFSITGPNPDEQLQRIATDVLPAVRGQARPSHR